MMKAQFALLEALVSSVLLSSTLAMLSCILYLAPVTTGAYNFGYGNLFYDFADLLYKNSTAGACFTSGDYACALGFMRSMGTVYRMDYLGFTFGNSTVSYGSKLPCTRSSLECLPVRLNGSFSVACLYTCGD